MEVGGVRELVDPAAAVGRDGDALSALDEKFTAVFVVDAAKPFRAVVEIGLITGGMAVGKTLRAELNAGVR